MLQLMYEGMFKSIWIQIDDDILVLNGMGIFVMNDDYLKVITKEELLVSIDFV